MLQKNKKRRIKEMKMVLNLYYIRVLTALDLVSLKIQINKWRRTKKNKQLDTQKKMFLSIFVFLYRDFYTCYILFTVIWVILEFFLNSVAYIEVLVFHKSIEYREV